MRTRHKPIAAGTASRSHHQRLSSDLTVPGSLPPFRRSACSPAASRRRASAGNASQRGVNSPESADRQVKPGKASGRRLATAKAHPPRRKLDEPVGASGLASDQRQRGLGKLNDAAPVLVAGHHQLSAQFRELAPRPPEGLTFLHPPAGSGSRKQWRMARCPASRQPASGRLAALTGAPDQRKGLSTTA